MLTPQQVTKQSPFLGEPCALCRDPLAPGDEAIICPEDATRHHLHCWVANGNRCASYGCRGAGEITIAEPADETSTPRVDIPPAAQGRIARFFTNLSAGCLLLSISVAILLIAFSCFGIWAIADYILLEILGWQYRQPLGLLWFVVNA